ncbi:MAG: bifunctional tRNA (5-methylaminomethyl-2-thiouridine)(34)-methyltransferase MnmD/FAD-dependent 5-carboxymethylaminomethyl-2-thiouridine(34) oxidoreductase MnmC [Betaproteobacteria bacterium]|nr:bifunctional tRNA (5-methylaminomethyl-2-thiouridine)(34)-methyltransferase MnmD/FAD-dependent 5-carboxymethylaminomethyl-2-thiouridine(34) oxidoreductase MnmC [Betaproteobacteria bacterium]
MPSCSLALASLTYTADGTPYSAEYGDVYHSAAGGLEQARHVFLGGNRLLSEHARWRGRERFVIVETGFGLGLNFLATWQAWRDDPQRSARLHFVSFEKHPFTATDLAVLHQRWPQLADCSRHLLKQWPPLLPGAHRLHFDDERVTLTLFLGDAQALLPKLRARADAFYLDGFAPDKNPELWSPQIFSGLARLAANDATLATWTVSAAVRKGLSASGFVIETAPGFSPKREMSRGVFRIKRDATVAPSQRHAMVIGAGLAGCAVAERLAARGWQVTLIDAASAPAQGASGNPAGVLRPQPSLDDNPLARLSRAAYLYALRHLHTLTDANLPLRWDDCGVLYLARDPVHEESQRRIADSHASTPDYLRFVERSEAAALACWPVSTSGWWFSGGGWVQPASLCRANLQRHAGRIQSCFGRAVERIQRHGEQWHAMDAAGGVIDTAPLLILANATDGRRLAGELPLRNARGQVSLLPQSTTPPVEIVVCQDGYITPAVDGLHCIGASFSVDDEKTEARLADHHENLARLDTMLPGYTGNIDPAALAGRVGFRSITQDRMPIIGAIPATNIAPTSTRMANIPRQPGLYGLLGLGSRGLVWATLAAELLAAQIEGEPLPLEGDLVDAVDPARFLLRQARRGILE